MMLIKVEATSVVVMMMMLSQAVQGMPNGKDHNVVLPTTTEELFADVDNSNAISQMLLSREPAYAKGVITEVAPNMFLANKFSMGNSLWVVTPQNTIIVIDSPEAVEVATQIATEMRKIPAIGNKPIKYIVYTIFHGDHTYGAGAFVKDAANNGSMPVIISHKNLLSQTDLFDNYRFIKLARVTRVFGSLIPKPTRIDPFSPLKLGQVVITQYYPNILLDMDELGDTIDTVLDGVPLKFIYVPGYTADQLNVWFPETKVLSCGDLFYSLLPNIYTIRGEPPRNPLDWAKSVRLIQKYNADVLAPQHFDPLFGAARVNEVLERTADTLQYIHDQTVRFMAKGWPKDRIAGSIQLPDSLKSEPFLAEVYGMIEGHARSVIDLYIGWFDGEAESLLPVAKDDLAANMVREFGRERLVQMARKAYDRGDYRWALTVSTYVWRAEGKQQNDALYWRTQSIKRLAENTPGVQWRNYLYSSAVVDWGLVPSQYLGQTVMASRPYYVALRTIAGVFELLAVHVDAVKAEGVDKSIELRLTDDPVLGSDKVYRMRLRNSVLAVDTVSSTNDSNSPTYTRIQTAQLTFKAILSNKLSYDNAVAAGMLTVVTSGDISLPEFLQYIDFVDQY